ncbi:MAG: class I tRNA ligase family protein, partial [Clostridia bacterium]|nr:class I tRNA ligase family protein [Clostridia bacterium]
INRAEMKAFITLLSPFAPHISEELWETLGGEGMLANGKWIDYDEAKTVADTVEIPVQINGKLRGTVIIPADADKDTALAVAKEDAKIKSYLEGHPVVKEIFVPGRTVNIVIK